MSCIVGLVHDGAVYIGGDSLAIGEDDIVLISMPKVFRNGDMLLGVAGSLRMNQLLQHALEPPYRKPDTDVMTYLVTSFAAAVLETFANGHYPRKAEDEPNGAFLIGYAGRLFCMHGDCSLLELQAGCYAIGSGDNAALGALYATQGQPPMERVRIALEAAEALNAAVRGPFTIDVLERVA